MITSINPHAQSYLDRLAAIDWWGRTHDVPAISRAYAARLTAIGLDRRIVWTEDPESRSARAARAARVAWDARDGIGWLNLEPETSALIELRAAYTPMIDAYLAGSGTHILTDDEVVVIAAPRIRMDAARRLHCETGPAVAWSQTVQHWWHGTRVPATWVEERESLTAQIALTWPQIEQRRAACEIIGWDRILTELSARTIDADPDPLVGTLVEVDLPDSGPERFLYAMCGTGRLFALPVPREMQSAVEAQAWTWSLPEHEFHKPEVRT